MKSRANVSVAAAGSVVLLILVGGWLLWRYYGTRPITLSDGRVVPDLSLAEAPTFGGDRFAPSRRAYLEKLERYRTFEVRPAPAQATAAADLLGPLIRRSIENDRQSQAAIRQLPKDAIDRLVEQAGVSLARLAGLPRDEYVALLPAGARAGPPSADGTVRVLVETYAPGGIAAPPDEAAPATRWRGLFDAVYALNLAYGDGDTLVRGIAVAPETFHCAVDAPRPWDPSADQILVALVQDRLDADADQLLLGGASQAQAVIFQSPEPWDQFVARGQPLIHAEIVLLVENGAGDRYPVSLLYYYDPAQRAWWLRGVTRKASLRALSTPAFVF